MRKACVICGKKFKAAGHKITCGKSCSYARKLQTKRRPHKPPEHRACVVCGTVFEVTGSGGSRRRNTCSQTHRKTRQRAGRRAWESAPGVRERRRSKCASWAEKNREYVQQKARDWYWANHKAMLTKNRTRYRMKAAIYAAFKKLNQGEPTNDPR